MLCVAFVKLLIRWLGVLLLAFAGLITAAWAFGAVWCDGPFGREQTDGGTGGDRCPGRAFVR